MGGRFSRHSFRPSLRKFERLVIYLAEQPISIAYLANQFPSSVEPYVCDEIAALRRQGFTVLPCSARRTSKNLVDERQKTFAAETLYLEPLRIGLLGRALWLCVRERQRLSGLLRRILGRGRENPSRRVRALLHTWLGAYYALRLQERGIRHIHVHHGYFSSWIAMVAALSLEIKFSMTLHGSDLLLHGAYLDLKLKHSAFCLTVSDFNRNYVLQHYVDVDPGKVIVQRIGVAAAHVRTSDFPRDWSQPFTILAVGRLHAIKDHAFLVRACRQLKDRGFNFECLIAGEGPERRSLEGLIQTLHMKGNVNLLGHIAHPQLDTLYATCDLVVLTSRSEGIPLVLMEAMARKASVLAPAITGIPELVFDGRTGFLYQPGSLEDFVESVVNISQLGSALKPVREAARSHVISHFDREKNLSTLADLFRQRLQTTEKSYADPLLQ